MVGQMDTSKFILHPEDSRFGTSIGGTRMVNDKGMLYGKWENGITPESTPLSWANSSPYKDDGILYNPYSEDYRKFIRDTNRMSEDGKIPSEQQVSVSSGLTGAEGYRDHETGQWVVPLKSALDEQVAGNHYKEGGIQPIEFITKNNLSFIIGNVIKYAFRADKKGGKEDLFKCIHYLRIELETKYGIRSEVKYQE